MVPWFNAIAKNIVACTLTVAGKPLLISLVCTRNSTLDKNYILFWNLHVFSLSTQGRSQKIIKIIVVELSHFLFDVSPLVRLPDCGIINYHCNVDLFELPAEQSTCQTLAPPPFPTTLSIIVLLCVSTALVMSIIAARLLKNFNCSSGRCRQRVGRRTEGQRGRG